MEDAGIYARESGTLGRVVQLAIASSQVIDVSFPETAPDDAEADHPLLDRVFAYLDGAEDEFADVETAITVPTDQRTVLEAVDQIPYGETGTTRQVAHMANLNPDDEDDAETVRTALRANPVPIFVPDHRVENAPGATPADVAATLRNIEAGED
ncbi:MAG: MGMT family protein [Halolamina sp.]